jgi:hypothetical protein
MQDTSPGELLGRVTFALLLGVTFGIVPRWLATKRQREAVGNVAFAVCVALALTSGVTLVAPVAVLLSLAIYYFWDVPPPPRKADRPCEDAEPLPVPDANLEQTPPPAPYTEIGDAVVCAACQTATGTSQGFPSECSHCGQAFTVQLARARRVAADDDVVPLEVADPNRCRK